MSVPVEVENVENRHLFVSLMGTCGASFSHWNCNEFGWFWSGWNWGLLKALKQWWNKAYKHQVPVSEEMHIEKKSENLDIEVCSSMQTLDLFGGNETRGVFLLLGGSLFGFVEDPDELLGLPSARCSQSLNLPTLSEFHIWLTSCGVVCVIWGPKWSEQAHVAIRIWWCMSRVSQYLQVFSDIFCFYDWISRSCGIYNM